ncbi:unnamed protein product [Urochloa humidicola]
MASTSSAGDVGGSGAKGAVPDESLTGSANASNSNQESHDVGTKSRVEDIWKKMNSGLPNKMPTPTMTKLSTTAKEKKNKPTNNWMSVLGLSPSNASTANKSPQNGQQQAQHETSEDAKKLAAAALAAAKNAAAMASGRGKVEITEVRDLLARTLKSRNWWMLIQRRQSRRPRLLALPPPLWTTSSSRYGRSRSSASWTRRRKTGESTRKRIGEWRRSLTPTRRARTSTWTSNHSCSEPIIESLSASGMLGCP